MYEEMEGMANQDPVDPAKIPTETEESETSAPPVDDDFKIFEKSASPDSEPALDPADHSPALETDRADLAELREEVKRLREALASKDAAVTRMREECDELWELYPGITVEALPDEVWEAVRRGIPVAAAVALSERKKFLTVQRAAAANAENRMRSSGAFEHAKNSYFSPDEVRSMSVTEVRENYQSILKSMQKWK